MIIEVATHACVTIVVWSHLAIVIKIFYFVSEKVQIVAVVDLVVLLKRKQR